MKPCSFRTLAATEDTRFQGPATNASSRRRGLRLQTAEGAVTERPEALRSKEESQLIDTLIESCASSA